MFPAKAFSGTASVAVSSASAEADYWLRPYPLEPYAEYWHLNLTARDLSKTLPAVIVLLEKNGGQSNVPLSSSVSSNIHHYQQLSYRLTAPGATKVLKAVKKLGRVDSMTTIPASSLVDMPEVEKKLSQLKQESAANRDALSHMPTTSAIVSELANRLSLTERVYAEAKGRVLLNIELQESAAAPAK